MDPVVSPRSWYSNLWECVFFIFINKIRLRFLAFSSSFFAVIFLISRLFAAGGAIKGVFFWRSTFYVSTATTTIASLSSWSSCCCASPNRLHSWSHWSRWINERLKSAEGQYLGDQPARHLHSTQKTGQDHLLLLAPLDSLRSHPATLRVISRCSARHDRFLLCFFSTLVLSVKRLELFLSVSGAFDLITFPGSLRWWRQTFLPTLFHGPSNLTLVNVKTC